MTRENYQRVKGVLYEVLDAPADERDRCISRHCSGDAELESAVRRLLAEFENSGILDAPPVEPEELGRLLARLDETNLPETLLAGRFRLIRFLGAGGMGEVWEAFDEELGQTIAVKLIRSEIAVDPKAISRFKREVLNARSVSHPHVCRVYDLFVHQSTSGELPFLTMQLVAGETLAERLGRGPVPRGTGLRLLEQTASALAAAHAAGLVHGDIKPGNVMLTGKASETPVAIVMDFGLARQLQDPETMSTVAAPFAGTPAYMAPEQAEGKRLTAAADVYAFGILVCEVITGSRPADGGLELLPRGLRRRVESALSPDPSARPASPAAILAVRVRRWQAAIAASLLVAAGVLISWFQPFGNQQRTLGKTIAVLPFTVEGGVAEDKYFNERISDEIIASLSRSTELRVIARNSTSQFTGGIQDTQALARKLHARYLVMGSVRFNGDHLEASAELVNPETRAVLWSATFSRSRTQIGALHAEIARGVAGQLGIVKGGQAFSAFGPEAVGQDAADLYLRGRELWSYRGRQNLRDALASFEEAVRIAPGFAAAYAARADTLMIMAEASYVLSAEALPIATESAIQAITLDPQLPEAHAALGLVQSIGNWDFYNAAKSLERALQLNPSNAYAHQWYAAVLLKTGNPGRAEQEAELAALIDPLSPSTEANIGWTKYYSGDYAGALGVADRMARDFSQFPYTCLLRADSEFGRKDFARSVAALEACPNEIRNNPLYLRSLAGVNSSLGNRPAVEGALARILAMTEHQPVSESAVAAVYSSLGRADEAFHWLDQGIIHRDPLTAMIDVTPYFAALHADPRYPATLARTGSHYRK